MKFYSENPHQFIGYRQLPSYPLTSLKVKIGGIDFANGEFTTDDEVLITALKRFISVRKGKYCPIYIEGQEQCKAVIEPVIEPLRMVDKEEEFKEFTRLLRL